MKGIVLKNQRELKTSIIKQTKEQKMYIENVDQHLSKIIAAKQSTLEALPLYHSTVTYASVVKGTKYSNIEEDNVSNMTEPSNEKRKYETDSSKRNRDRQKTSQSEEHSADNQSSVWSKESVVNKINMLSEELKKERSKREAERKERLKEKEETRVIFESMK